MGARLPLLLAALALLGVGFFVGRLVPPEPALDPSEPLTPRSGAAPAPGPTLLGQAPAAQGGAADAVPAPLLARLRETIDALPLPPLPTGTGVITGRVRTADGQPIPGVDVHLRPEFPELPAPGIYRDDADPAEQIAWRARNVLWGRAAKRVQTTGAGGDFRFEGMSDHQHRIHASRDGWQVLLVSESSSVVRPGAVVEFVGREIAEVELTVHAADGTLAPTAAVEFQSSQTTRNYTLTGGQQRIPLDPGPHVVTARGGPDGRFRSESTTVDLAPGRVQSLRLVLAARPAILVRLRFAEGEAVLRSRVVIARVPEGSTADVGLLATPLAEREFESGTLAFHDVQPGRYLVGASRGQAGALAVNREVVVGDAAVDVDLDVPPLRREEYVALRVLGPDGVPAEDPQLALGYYSEGGASARGGAGIVRRPDGTLWVLHTEVEAPSPQGYRWIEAALPGLGVRRVVYGAREAPDLTLRFEQPVVAELVLGAIPAPYDGRVQVRLGPVQEGGTRIGFMGGAGATAASVSGHVRIEGVQPGRYLASVLVVVGGRPQEVARTQLEITAAHARHNLAFPSLHSVTLAGAAAGRLHVAATDREGGDWFAGFQVPAGSEAVTVDGLPPGEYSAHQGARQVKFRVPGQETVRFGP